MNQPTYAVWGFDGHFKGNEARIQLVPPVIVIGGAIWVVRHTSWDPTNKQGLKALDPDRAQHVVTPIPPDVLCVTTAEWLVVAGPEYVEALRRMNTAPGLTTLPQYTELPNAFGLAVLDAAAFERFLAETLDSADRRYRDELRTHSSSPTPMAKSAFHVLHHTPMLDALTFFARDVVHARWEGDDAKEQRVVRVATLLGEVTGEELEIAAEALWREHDSATSRPRWQRVTESMPSSRSPIPRHEPDRADPTRQGTQSDVWIPDLRRVSHGQSVDKRRSTPLTPHLEPTGVDLVNEAPRPHPIRATATAFRVSRPKGEIIDDTASMRRSA